MVNKADEALNAPAVELIRAASRPATTSPRMPAGMTFTTMSGNAACATPGIALPSGPTISARPGARPVLASASAIMPGMMKMNTGRRSEEHTSELQSRGHLVCRLLLEKKKKTHRPGLLLHQQIHHERGRSHQPMR